MSRTNPWIGVDIGGTLSKVCVFIPNGEHGGEYNAIVNKLFHDNPQDLITLDDQLEIQSSLGTLYFARFLSKNVVNVSDLMLHVIQDQTICATGGGAVKYEDSAKKRNIDWYKYDELDCLVRGIMLLSKLSNECFSVVNHGRFAGEKGHAREHILTKPVKLDAEAGIVVVNIGSGVSILDLENGLFERIGGSSLGGSTFLGLCSVLTGCDNFDDAIDLASEGDSARVDLLVKDIYGGKLKGLHGLRGSTLAASFGKLMDKQNREKVKNSDLALSTLIMLSMNVAAIAYLHAKMRKRTSILFTGNFLSTSRITMSAAMLESIHLHPHQTLKLHKRNTLAMRTLAYAIHFWSKGKVEAIFLKHEGYCGALGALNRRFEIIGNLGEVETQSKM